ncbi:MAG: hypothetical protein HDQ87_11885 [Clostridia bacterium]|nr:hypothetical protein [Clostridia bacterium]
METEKTLGTSEASPSPDDCELTAPFGLGALHERESYTPEEALAALNAERPLFSMPLGIPLGDDPPVQWVMSDIHGCIDQYKWLLTSMNLRKCDRLYVLGDAIDRGPASMDVLCDVIFRPEITYIPGNHDYFLLRLGPHFGFRPEEGRARASLFDQMLYAAWMLDGGSSTLRQFRALPVDKRREILHYLENAPAVVETSVGSRKFILVHEATRGFLERPRFSDWTLRDFMRRGFDYYEPILPDERTVVSGHKWTAEIRRDGASEIFSFANNIAVDCGCVQGGRLGAYCLDNTFRVYAPGYR